LNDAAFFLEINIPLEERFEYFHVGYLIDYIKIPCFVLAQFFRPNSQYVKGNVSELYDTP
jgi:hypothetical protein